MKIVVLDDYQDAFRKLSCFARLASHEVQIFHDTVKEPAALAARLGDAEAVLLIQQRSALPRAVVEQLPDLKLISQTGRNVSHIDLPACTERGIVVSAGGAGPPNATAELTWGLILAALRHVPQEVEWLKAGQ
jgi:D-3-phosphoglycerate dehydrogenase